MALGAILGGISAVTSIAGGISGAATASKNAAKARKEQKRAQELAEKRAELTNKYNMKRFKNEKANFLANRQFNYDQAMKQYDYAVKVQDLEYDTQIRAYNKDQQNLSNQLAFNRIGERQAYMREQNVMRDITAEQVYERQEAYIEGLKSRAAATLSPAGASGDRAVQMALAETGRKLAVMDASYTGQIREHAANMFDIALNVTGADMNAKGQSMLRPSEPIALIQPEITPLPKFTKPMEVMPEYVSQYVPSPDTMGTILGGIGGAASALSGIDFTNKSSVTPAPKMPNYGGGVPGGGLGGSSGGYTAPTPKFQFSTNPFSAR